MVRFKGISVTPFTIATGVSIPIWFDLKGNWHITSMKKPKGFNSYMVRFKDKILAVILFAVIVFQFLYGSI